MNQIDLGARLKKLVINTELQKTLSNSELQKAMEEFAVYDGFGRIDETATLFKVQRRRVLNKLKPWEATANPFKDYPGTSLSAPRGSGPAPRKPADIPVMGQDHGNAATAILTSAGVLAEAGIHDPVKAYEIMLAVIANTRLAQGLI